MRIAIQKKWTVLGLLLILLFGACRSNKTIPYFKNIPPSDYQQIKQVAFTQPTIMPDDILEISVHTADPAATGSISEGGVTVTTFQSAGSGSQRVKGYPVSKEGTIDVPIIGIIKVAGLTTSQVKDIIKEKADRYFQNPSVQIKILNFKVTVLGEVTSPQTYNVPSEKISILDAIGMAGDLTIFGKRENVLLIRETNQGKEMIRFNLNDAKIFDSPYFYLKQNDVVYVEPSKSRIANAEAPKIAIISSILAVISTIIILISK